MNKIKIKLTGDQCGIIAILIQEFKLAFKDPNSLILADLMMEVLEKIHGRSLWMDKNYTISLTPAQGRAFNLYFIQMYLTGYELNLIRLIMADIDKQLNNGIRGSQKTHKSLKRLA